MKAKIFPRSSLFFFNIFLIFMLIFSSCQKYQSPEVSPAYQEKYNQAYGADPLQRFDLFLPEGRNEHTQMILVLHGGGWVSGEKEYVNYYAKRFSDFGFAAASMNYRLANDSVHYGEMLADIDSMIGCVLKNAGLWSIGIGQVNLFGYSAGGHLALLYSYSVDKNRMVRSVISLAGPTDLQDSLLWKDQALYKEIRLMTGDTLPANWSKANPICFISQNNPPTLLIHGEIDSLVPVSQSIKLNHALESYGATVKLSLFENETHFFTPDATIEATNQIRNFLLNHSTLTSNLDERVVSP